MSSINPKNYELVWTMEGIPYLFDSIYLEAGFLNYNFIAINAGENHTLYVSKQTLAELGKKGIELYSNKFADYKNKLEARYPEVERFINEERTRDLSKLDNKELRANFSHFVKFSQELMTDYFWTESFCLYQAEALLPEAQIQDIGKLKLWQREYLNKIMLYPPTLLERYAEEIAKGFRLDDVNSYHYRELLTLLEGKSVFAPERDLVVRGKFSDWKDILGEEAEKIVTELRSAEISTLSTTEFKGVTGNKGKYQGKVRIIKLRLGDPEMFREIEAMQPGEVLVSEATGPDMMLAIKKAGAIITEAGGITSHAAIVSREFNIPCVLNVKRVTQILKNGDEVEVDADSGVIKRLN